MLITIENVLSKDDVAAMRARLNSAPWQDGRGSAGSLARQQKRNQQLDESDPLAISLGNEILRKIGNNAVFVSAALPNKIYPPRFNRYADNGEYGAHVDSAIMRLPGSNAVIRSDVSVTLFLSEPDEYDGGELEIETATGVQAVKLEAGDMVVYPSTTLHRVTPVTRGARIASFFWLESLVLQEAHRALLFDLDQAIQTLRAGPSPDQDTILKLSAVYNNLLRGWTIT
jgi:PKHD-type hydroxylase